MAKRSILSEDEQQTEIDLSPMIDCIFILLIFFIVTTVFVEEKGLEVYKPDAAASVALDVGDDITLEITASNVVMLEGEEISMADVTARVRATVRDDDIPVIIRAHEKAKHGIFVSVWDAAAKGGAKNMSFSTIN